MRTLFKQIIDENYLPCGVHEEFVYTVNRDGKMLNELLRHLEKIKIKDRHLNLSIDLTHKLLEEYNELAR